ncbi:zinc finger BED domain-containing protein RICESLEEPER 2-like [Pistacia vera]|uniref:zinc finger BED domain-containing protein RICESLEEPER 2-like n=1 Tax=Pistacia vera TaxID=55513 RepID=UPI001262F263|nr:zinc finger BED domain-containing protein RICESLEEPER 2-like [Pistacia vera]
MEVKKKLTDWRKDLEVSNCTQIEDNGKGKVDTEIAPPPPPTKRRRTSKVWEMFDKIKREDGTELAICKHCKKQYPGSSKTAGTSNLLKHMGKCAGRRDGDGGKPCDEIKEKRSYKSITRSDPLSVVEKDSSENFGSYSNLKANILHTYRKEKEKLTSFINNPSSGRFNLTINCWRRTDGRNTNCCLTKHFIDNGWELKSKVLAFRRVGFSDNRGLFGTFRSMILDWRNLDKNVFTITAQYTEEAYQIASEIKGWLLDQNLLPLTGTLSHVSCLVHILNLLLEDGSQEVNGLLFNTMKCISYVHNKPDSVIKFRMAVDQARAQGSSVTYEDMPAKGTLISFQKFEGIFRLREAFNMLKIFDLDFNSLNINPEDEEWIKATYIYKHVKVLDEAVKSLSGKQSCLTTNVYFPKVCNIYRSLCEWVKGDNSNVSSMAGKMKKKFDTYWENCGLVLAIAIVLDPRFKLDIVKRWFQEIYGQDDAEEQCVGIEFNLKQIYKEYSGGGSNNLTAYFDTLDPLGMPWSTSCSNDAEDGKSEKSELERYLEEPKFRSVKDFDILTWWRANTPNFPILAKMARDFLAIPVSTAQSNPSFNDDVMKIDPTAIDIDPETTEAFVCVRDWRQRPENKA